MNEEFDFPEESGLSEQDQSSIQNLGAVTAQGEKSAIHCLTIVGQIVIVDNYYSRQWISRSKSLVC
ncbi:MAG: hypothetical protein FWG31_03590 [Oscillospiraceae bacterium]|nr:hypothetical protein [Oscillospiraceae bacterium]